MNDELSKKSRHDRKVRKGQWFCSVAIVALIFVLSLLILTGTRVSTTDYIQLINSADVLGEGLLLLLTTVWIITIAVAGLRWSTYLLLVIGFTFMSAANAADLLDEFIIGDMNTILGLVENLANPLGMFITSIGLWEWSRNHLLLISQMNRERIIWRNRSCVDELTGLYSRRYFFDKVPSLLSQARLQQRSVALLMLDIDHFKSVNDQYGHGVGDLLLTEIGHAISGFQRKDDLGFRLGGEEFAVIIFGADAAVAQQAADRLRQRITSAEVMVEGGDVVVRTVSIGATLLLPEDNVKSWLGRADELLYVAKNQGRNRVEYS